MHYGRKKSSCAGYKASIFDAPSFGISVSGMIIRIHVTLPEAHTVFYCVTELVRDEKEKSDWFL